MGVRPCQPRADLNPTTSALGWPSLLEKDGDELEVHYRHVLEERGRQPGMLGEIWRVES